MIARYAPGMGNPWKLTHGQWVLALIRIDEILRTENPPADETKMHLEHIRQMKRDAWRSEQWKKGRKDVTSQHHLNEFWNGIHHGRGQA